MTVDPQNPLAQLRKIQEDLARAGQEGLRRVAPVIEAFAVELRKARLVPPNLSLRPSRLWTIQQVADHWGVTESRARHILAAAGVKSGYDPDVVKAIPRPGQGTRTDLKRKS